MATRQQIKTLAGLGKRDFFGIQDITSKDIAAAFSNRIKLSQTERDKKYDALLKSRHRLINEVREKPKMFGAIRYDGDNEVKRHGQCEEGATEKLHDTVEVKQLFVPDQEQSAEHEFDEDGVSSVPGAEEVAEVGNAPYKISEVQTIKAMNEVLELFRSPNDKAKATLRYANKPPLMFYFEGVPREKAGTGVPEPIASPQPEDKKEAQPEEDQSNEKPKQPLREYERLAGPEGLQVPLHELDPFSEEYIERQIEMNKTDRFDRELDQQVDVPEGEPPSKPMKALDYLNQVRAKKVEPTTKVLKQQFEAKKHPYSFLSEVKLDSKGYNVYTYQVPDWSSVRRVDALEYLRSCIVYNNYDILAINKPYGISSHENTKGCEPFDMNSLVAELARSLRINKVFLTHRLDKTTTGILLFATSEKRAQDLHKLFRNNEIKKSYWCITKGVPDPLEGVLDMPIGEFEVAGKLRSVPVPDNLDDDDQLAKRHREARRAVTEYKVLKKTRLMALVECKPQSGVKHQIRCHLGFGLKTPILGDHKYSHINKLAPQQLPRKVLDSLRLRQSKVRTLPMHLHAKSIVIPGAKANNQTLYINAEPPQHFRDNLTTLRLDPARSGAI